MKLSTRGRYGLRAMIDLAVHSLDGAVSISSIAARQELSESYLEQLMSKLKKAGLIISVRGAQGGYLLARAASDISVGDVLRALEGDLNPVVCAAISGSSACNSEDTCVTKYVWKKISESINAAVDGIPLSELIEESLRVGADAKRKRNCAL